MAMEQQQAQAGNSAALEQIFTQQKLAFKAQSYPSYEQRKQNLQSLYQMLVDHQDEIAAAISRDFSNRSADETRLFEVMTSLNGIKHSLKYLKKWMKPSKRDVGILFQPAKGYVLYQPLGVVGVIVPWNYPLLLSVGPLICALAAGNHAMIKISSSSAAFGAVLEQALAEQLARRRADQRLAHAQHRIGAAAFFFEIAHKASLRVGHNQALRAHRHHHAAHQPPQRRHAREHHCRHHQRIGGQLNENAPFQNIFRIAAGFQFPGGDAVKRGHGDDIEAENPRISMRRQAVKIHIHKRRFGEKNKHR